MPIPYLMTDSHSWKEKPLLKWENNQSLKTMIQHHILIIKAKEVGLNLINLLLKKVKVTMVI
jgi:hypothetical protein